MRESHFIRPDCARRVSAMAAALSISCLVLCTTNSLPIPEADYSTKIVGRWRGTVGDLKETMSINADGTFSCQLRSTGFIANTLSQSETGTVQGTWTVVGTIIALKITGAENERLTNINASSTIMSFKKDELVLKSGGGETSPFQRVRSL